MMAASNDKTTSISKEPRVVVLSQNYSTGLSILRSLGEAGYTVDLVAGVKKKGRSIIASSSRFVHRAEEVLLAGDPASSAPKIWEAVKQLSEDAPAPVLLFPADDYMVTVLECCMEASSSRFVLPGVKQGSYTLPALMNKDLQVQLAADAGLAVAGSWIVHLADPAPLEGIPYPCFVKPRCSVGGSKEEMAICRDQAALEETLAALARTDANRDVLVQEYLEIDQEYDVGGVCTREEVLLPGVIRKIRVAAHERGVTMAGEMLPASVLGDSGDKVKRLLQQTGYIGMFDLEIFDVGGQLYFNEINFRPGGPNFVYYRCGMNLPAAAAEALLSGGAYNGNKEVLSVDKTFVYEKVAWEDQIYGHMSRQERKSIIREADITLLHDANDPAPGKHFDRRIRLSAVKHWLRRDHQS